MYLKTNEMLERRFKMCSFILSAGKTHYTVLMKEFSVSKPTAVADVKFISEYLIPLETESGRAGYIRAVKYSYKNLIRLSDEDAASLNMLFRAIRDEEMDQIIRNKEQILRCLSYMMAITIPPGKQLEEL